MAGAQELPRSNHGAPEAYNGAKTITVTGPTTFTYDGVAGNPTTPATGSKSFILGIVTALEPRTFDQFKTAIQTKITSGAVDNGP